jgi:hypothetical protein
MRTKGRLNSKQLRAAQREAAEEGEAGVRRQAADEGPLGGRAAQELRARIGAQQRAAQRQPPGRGRLQPRMRPLSAARLS